MSSDRSAPVPLVVDVRAALVDTRRAVVRSALTVPKDLQIAGRFGMTRREIDVARHMAAGLRNAEIAVCLGVSIHTVRRHTERVLRKLGVRSRAAVLMRLLEG